VITEEMARRLCVGLGLDESAVRELAFDFQKVWPSFYLRHADPPGPSVDKAEEIDKEAPK